MQLKKSDALELKFKALRWLRMDQRCPFIATEAGANSADVLGINEKKMIEVEVKVTKEDLRNDFRKHKHHQYIGKDYFSGEEREWVNRWIPNQFYFAVPDELVELAKQLSDEKAKGKYGVISLTDFKVIKRAKKLHDREPDSRTKLTLSLRMGSELIRFHEAWL